VISQSFTEAKVSLLTPKTKYKRGYAVATLIGIEETSGVVWKVFSHVAKHERTVTLSESRGNLKSLYNFHEAIVNTLRPILREGVRSIILASPSRTNYSQEFVKHVRQHHAWLNQGPSKAVLSEITGSASTQSQVAALTRTTAFHELVDKTALEETENLLDLLEKRLNTSDNKYAVLFSLEEAEGVILKHQKPGEPEPEFLLLTDTYLANTRQKNRVHRLMQIAANRNVKTRIVNTESPAGKRITQLGGLVCLVH